MRSFLYVILFSVFTISASAQVDQIDFEGVVANLIISGDQISEHYNQDYAIDSADQFSDLYFDHFEGTGLEKKIALRSTQHKTHLESLFGTLIGQASAAKDLATIQRDWHALKSALLAARPYYIDTQSSFISTLIQAFLILLREGFEAILVIGALAAYLHRQNVPQRKTLVSGACTAALLASALTAFLLISVIDTTGQQREAMEGVIMLMAAGILLYVGGWLYGKRDEKRWQQYIHSKMDAAVGQGRLWALGGAIFLAVYREGAETILFLQALYWQAPDQSVALVTGIALAALALTAIYVAINLLSMKIPMRTFFTATAAMIFVLALSFTGNGILELQNAGWITNTHLSYAPSIVMLGVHPSVETITLQVFVLLIPSLFIWLRHAQKPETNEGSQR